MRGAKRYYLIGCFILVAVLLIWEIADAPRAIERARSVETARDIGNRLSMGMSRGEVEQQLGQHVKKQYHCDYGSASEDIYLIGSKDPKRAGILYLRYTRVDGKEILQKISGLDSDMLFEFEGERCTVFGKQLEMGRERTALKALLGGHVRVFLNASCDGAACAPRGAREVWIPSFSGSLDEGAKVVAHELAHVIDWQGGFSARWAPYTALSG